MKASEVDASSTRHPICRHRSVAGQRACTSPTAVRFRPVGTILAGSFNGRISGSEPEDRGSTPWPASIWRVAQGASEPLKLARWARYLHPLPYGAIGYWLGRRPLKAEESGSNPTGATNCARIPTGRGTTLRALQVCVRIAPRAPLCWRRPIGRSHRA